MKKSGTVLAAILGAIAGAVGSGYLGQKQIEQKNAKVDKFKAYYNMLNQWLILKQEGKTLENYFIDNGYKSIAIYGMGEMGNRLYDELKGTSIEIKYAIDKNADSTYSELDVFGLEDEVEEVDVVVVTAVFAMDEIERDISENFICAVIPLEDVVYER